MELKLAKLPDRTPVKITITVKPELNQMLLAYQAAYKAAYLRGGEEESVADLIPFMVQSFLESDRKFLSAMRENGRKSDVHHAVRGEGQRDRVKRIQTISSNHGDGSQS